MNAARTPILLYHHVESAPSTPPPRFASSYLPLAEFRAQLDNLARRGLRTLTLAEAVTRPRRERGVVLTFDDGCRCFADVVAPELAERGMTATVFAVSGLLGASNRWDEERGERREELLDAVALGRLAEDGIEIGCHSRTHRDLAGASADELAAEVSGAKRELEEAIGRPVQTFCYPYGHFDDASRAAVVAAGFDAAVSVWGVPGAVRRDRFALPRVEISPGESPGGFRLKASAAYPWFRRLPRLGLLAALRRVPGAEVSGA